jgi:outer membrane lipoprotein carrier protein
MGRIFSIVVGFFALTSFARGDALSDAQLKDLLARIRQNPVTQADFQEQRIIHLMKKPILNSGKIWFARPNKFRREVSGNSPSLTVSDGQQLWIYYPNFKSAERYSLGKRSPLDSIIASINSALNLENVKNTFHITAIRINNGYELELTPRTAAMNRVFQKVSLHVNDKLHAERTEMLQLNGDRIVTTYSNQSRAPLPPSTFEFTPPPGTNITTPLGQ